MVGPRASCTGHRTEVGTGRPYIISDTFPHRLLADASKKTRAVLERTFWTAIPERYRRYRVETKLLLCFEVQTMDVRTSGTFFWGGDKPKSPGIRVVYTCVSTACRKIRHAHIPWQVDSPRKLSSNEISTLHIIIYMHIIEVLSLRILIFERRGVGGCKVARTGSRG